MRRPERRQGVISKAGSEICIYMTSGRWLALDSCSYVVFFLLICSIGR